MNELAVSGRSGPRSIPTDSSDPRLDPLLRLRVERFLHAEADAMDQHRYTEWLDLWADEDVLYWVPCNDRRSDPRTHVSLVYADRRLLEERVRRLESGEAHAQIPPTALSRVVSNITVRGIDDDGLLEVTSKFLLVALRHGHQEVHAADVEHRLVGHDGSALRIRRKMVDLLAKDSALGNLTYLI